MKLGDPLVWGEAALGAASQPVRAKAAAEQFEGLLIAELLKAANPSGDSDESLSTALQFAQEQLAQSVAARGGLGLSKIIRTGLEQQENAIIPRR